MIQRNHRGADATSWEAFARKCQKPDYRTVGNWMARRVSRPLALYATWCFLSLGVRATTVTMAAWCGGLFGAWALGWGNMTGWLVGAAALQIWYLLDHVDGQIARYRGSETLDGAALDYLMHHTVNLCVPIGAGWGLFRLRDEPGWFVAGLVWGVASLVVMVRHDARYKAFVKRLKRLDGEMRVTGGASTARPVGRGSEGSTRSRWVRGIWFSTKKACEPHVVMNFVTLVALTTWVTQDADLLLARGYLGIMAIASMAVAVGSVSLELRQRQAETEFEAWFRPLDGEQLVQSAGWWRTEKRPIRAPSQNGRQRRFREESHVDPIRRSELG